MIIWRSWSPVTLLRSRTTLWNKALLSCSSLTNSMRNSTVWPALFWFHLHQPWFCWPPHYSITYCAVWESCRWPSAAVWISPFKWRKFVFFTWASGIYFKSSFKIGFNMKKENPSVLALARLFSEISEDFDLPKDPFRFASSLQTYTRSVEHFQITKKKSLYWHKHLHILHIISKYFAFPCKHSDTRILGQRQGDYYGSFLVPWIVMQIVKILKWF